MELVSVFFLIGVNLFFIALYNGMGYDIIIKTWYLILLFILNLFLLFTSLSYTGSEDFWSWEFNKFYPFSDGFFKISDYPHLLGRHNYLKTQFSFLEFSVYGVFIFILFLYLNRVLLLKVLQKYGSYIFGSIIIINIITSLQCENIWNLENNSHLFFPFIDYPEGKLIKDYSIIQIVQEYYSYSEFIFYTSSSFLLFIYFNKSLKQYWNSYWLNLKLGCRKLLKLFLFLIPLVFIFTELFIGGEIKSLFFERSFLFVLYYFNFILTIITFFIISIIVYVWIKKDFNNI